MRVSVLWAVVGMKGATLCKVLRTVPGLLLKLVEIKNVLNSFFPLY